MKVNRFYETQSGLPLGFGIEVGFHNALSGTRLAGSFPVLAGNVCRTQAAHTSIGLGPLSFIDREYASLLKYSQGNSKLCHFGPVYPWSRLQSLARTPGLKGGIVEGRLLK